MQPTNQENTPLPLISPEQGIFETYSNQLDADWTLTDVTIRFMQLTFEQRETESNTQNREMVILEKANVTLPWWLAKKGASMLTDLIRSYEAVNGEIKEPVLAPRPSAPIKPHP